MHVKVAMRFDLPTLFLPRNALDTCTLFMMPISFESDSVLLSTFNPSYTIHW